VPAMQRSPLSTIVVLAVQPKKVPAVASQFGGAARSHRNSLLRHITKHGTPASILTVSVVV
jgi:hypothetical protein